MYFIITVNTPIYSEISIACEMAKTREKEPINIVHQNAILCETIGKEVRNQKLYTNYSINPFKKSLLLT